MQFWWKETSLTEGEWGVFLMIYQGVVQRLCTALYLLMLAAIKWHTFSLGLVTLKSHDIVPQNESPHVH